MHSKPPDRRLVIEFTKMSGAGNDFVVIDDRFYHFSDEELAELASRLCKRHTGIGADGLMTLSADDQTGVDFRMRYYNADGSRGSMCGNGARCLGRFARLAGMGGEHMMFNSDAGRYRIYVPDAPSDDVRLYVPGYGEYCHLTGLTANTDGSLPDADYVWTGTEHVVNWVENVATYAVQEEGPRLRKDKLLEPAGANINFAEKILSTPDQTIETEAIRVRTFEKGVEAETLACGTGAIAVSISAIRRGIVEGPRVAIQMPGGTLKVGYEGSIESPADLYLEGPADVVFRGTIEV